jgi:hypothetical protein
VKRLDEDSSTTSLRPMTRLSPFESIKPWDDYAEMYIMDPNNSSPKLAIQRHISFVTPLPALPLPRLQSFVSFPHSSFYFLQFSVCESYPGLKLHISPVSSPLTSFPF